MDDEVKMDDEGFSALQPIIDKLNAEHVLVDTYLKQVLGDAFVEHKRYQNIILIYGTHDGYEKLCEHKLEILKALKTRNPNASIRILRASNQ